MPHVINKLEKLDFSNLENLSKFLRTHKNQISKSLKRLTPTQLYECNKIILSASKALYQEDSFDKSSQYWLLSKSYYELVNSHIQRLPARCLSEELSQQQLTAQYMKLRLHASINMDELRNLMQSNDAEYEIKKHIELLSQYVNKLLTDYKDVRIRKRLSINEEHIQKIKRLITEAEQSCPVNGRTLLAKRIEHPTEPIQGATPTFFSENIYQNQDKTAKSKKLLSDDKRDSTEKIQAFLKAINAIVPSNPRPGYLANLLCVVGDFFIYKVIKNEKPYYFKHHITIAFELYTAAQNILPDHQISSKKIEELKPCMKTFLAARNRYDHFYSWDGLADQKINKSDQTLETTLYTVTADLCSSLQSYFATKDEALAKLIDDIVIYISNKLKDILNSDVNKYQGLLHCTYKGLSPTEPNPHVEVRPGFVASHKN